MINTQSIIVRYIVMNCDLKNETEMTHLIVNMEMLLLLASMDTEKRSLHTGLLILLPRFRYIYRKMLISKNLV